MNRPAFTERLKDRMALLREKWVSPFSFLIALLVHLVFITMGTTHYVDASSHPERSNQAVQKLESALKNKGVRFVYIKDVDPKEAKRLPDPQAPFSDRDRAGASPDGGKGKSWDPYSKGDTPQRQFGSPVQPPPVSRPGSGAFNSEGRDLSQKKAQSKAQEVIKEAEKQAAADRKKGGIEIRTDKKEGLPVKGEEGKGAPAPQEMSEGLKSQLGEMMLQTLKGSYHNPNASRLNQGAVSFETSGWDLGPYARIVQERVESNWRTPAVQEVLRQKGWVAIHFDIMKDGKIENVTVSRSSRIPSYDQAAASALIASNPLPPLPEQVTVPKISGTFKFFYNMWSEEEDSP